FRAYYAIRGLSTSKGFPTNAIYGFTTMLWKLIKERRPTHLAVVFDSKEPSFREELYPEYKANRAEPPGDLVPQFPYFRKVVAAMRLPHFEMPGFEADDIIGTLAVKMAAGGRDVVIVTGDKDFMQLVGDRVTLVDTMKEKATDAAGVAERFGVAPSLVTDVMGLAGDAVDNVPGIPGIGEKTAIKLIRQLGSLERVLASPDKIGGKLAEKISRHAEEARLAKRLVTIHTNVPIEKVYGKGGDGEEALRYAGPDQEALRGLFKELEFTRLLQELAPHASLSRAAYRCVLIEADLQELVAQIRKAGVCAIDTETTSLDPMQAGLVGISLAWAPGQAAYLPLKHDYLGAPEQLPPPVVQALLSPIMADPAIRKYAQNAKFDLPIFARAGMSVKGLICDTMIASYVLNPAGAHGLDAMAQQFLDHTMISYKSVVGTGKGAKKDFSEVPVEQAAEYSAEDADVTFQLAEKFLPMLKAEPGLWDLFQTIEMPLLCVLLEMEMTGVLVDADRLRELKLEFTARLQKLEARIYEAAGMEFNINSTQQLGEILFGKFQLPGGRRTKTGYSTDADVLEGLANRHPLPSLVLEYRSLGKLQSTYIVALLKLINPVTGRIHTSFNQGVAETGRLSSSEPNLQNIPARTEEGRRIREAFVAEAGRLLLSADYSQIELRILAHMSGDSTLREAFERQVDVHAETAATLFGGHPGGVTPKQRAAGKTVNFAVIYGQTPYGLSQGLGIPVEEAKQYIDQYFTKYDGVAAYHEQALSRARERGYVETIAKRRRYFPELQSQNAGVRANAERMAFNTIIQGSAADIIKIAMIRIAERLRNEGLATKMLLQVHDELVFEVPEVELSAARALVTEAMEQVMALSVSLKVDIGTGPNWTSCH
ncbi:MAG: DNA polymerase I, partial [Deltaproteobacteria bacterium]|nr:DNA polymerase I [Deltaproteobacteria bacterium]